MRPRLGTAPARSSRKAPNVRLRTVIRGLRSSRPVMRRMLIGLTVTASTTINPATAKSAIRRGEGSIGGSLRLFRELQHHGPGKAARAKKHKSLQRHPHCVDVRRRQGSIEREHHEVGEHLFEDFPHDLLAPLETVSFLFAVRKGGRIYQQGRGVTRQSPTCGPDKGGGAKVPSPRNASAFYCTSSG